LASDDELEARAIDWQINNSPDFDLPQLGELFYHGTQRLRLPSFDAQSPFGAAQTYLSMGMINYPSGAAALRPLASAWATHDFFAMVEGAEVLPLVQDDDVARVRRLFQELPGPDAEVRVERRQPITSRVYRMAGATTLCLINESAWPVEVELPIELNEPATWRALGTESKASMADEQAAGAATWSVSLPPYGVEARRYESATLRVGALAPKVGEDAPAALAALIGAIEQRVHALDVERPYPQLQNPDFELAGADGLMLGWQPRIGRAGHVAIDDATAATGTRALRLRSDDALGVAAQSHLFPIPGSGELTIRARVRVKDLAEDARVYAWVEFDANGTPRREYAALGEGRLGDAWTTCEFAVDDLPLASSGQMRVQFHLAGRGEAWVDGVELFDLRFSEEQRMRFTTTLFAAKIALEKGQLVECQRLVDGYWPRYLVENVPMSASAAEELLPPEVRVATLPDDAPPADGAEGESPGIGDRLRQWTPQFFRR
jgi:hypothetical protein